MTPSRPRPPPRPTGVVNTIPFAYRFHPMVREMRARVQSEEFGAINLIHGSYLQDWLLNPRSTSWRVDAKAGGPSRAFGDIGSHWCDLIEWVTGDRIAELVATTSITIKQRPASTAATMSAVESDAPLIDVDTEDSRVDLVPDGQRRRRLGRDHPAQRRAQEPALGGDRRHAAQCGLRPGATRATLIGAEAGTQILVRDPNHGSAEQRRLSLLPAGHVQGFAQCFENYVNDSYAAIDAYNGEGEAPEGLPTFADGARAAAICDAMLQSAQSRQWVKVS